MYKTKLIGREGEAEAARYLERKGYKIIGLNYSCRYGEIDVIAEKDGCAAIVEVKLRESADFAEAREFVTRSKQAKLRRAALHWLMTSGTELQPRFYVVEIYTGGREHIINHIENAFEYEAGKWNISARAIRRRDLRRPRLYREDLRPTAGFSCPTRCRR